VSAWSASFHSVKSGYSLPQNLLGFGGGIRSAGGEKLFDPGSGEAKVERLWTG
jgi:hypothetical protein